jgi:hypothetical protein
MPVAKQDISLNDIYTLMLAKFTEIARQPQYHDAVTRRPFRGVPSLLSLQMAYGELSVLLW